MLAQAEKPTNDFHALARYLVHGREKPTPENRVAWVLGRNLPDADPELAAKLMTATAQLSPRCRKACYHLMIAWHERERPEPEAMQAIAVAALERAGLGEHQALIMGHGDKPHRHLHMIVNRVPPTTGKAWATSHDYKLWDRIMRELSDEYGFEFVPAHRFNPERTDDLPKGPSSRATYAARKGADTRRRQWSPRQARAFSDRLSERLDPASTWHDVADLAADYGLTLEAKGNGYVIGDAGSYVKLSQLNLQRTAKGFVRAPSRRGKTKPFRPLVDEVDIVRGLAAFGLVGQEAVQQVIGKAQAERIMRQRRKPTIEQLLADVCKPLMATTALTRRTQGNRKRPHPSQRQHSLSRRDDNRPRPQLPI